MYKETIMVIDTKNGTVTNAFYNSKDNITVTSADAHANKISFYIHQFRYLKLRPDATAPTKSHTGDLGYDLYSVEEVKIPPGCKGIVSTGICVGFPSGWGGIVKDRSSMAMKTTLTTIAGVIDNGYTGELFIAFANYGSEEQTIQAGQKIAQIVPVMVTSFDILEVDNISSRDGRDGNGFGSTGY
jgi:dUTP pyrophosphatase